MFNRKPAETENNPWKTLHAKQVYDNRWISVSHREVINPSGGEGVYGVVHFKNVAIGVVPLDADLYTWIVGQYRYPLDRYSWEIPEGGGPHDIDLLASAQRELLEETGLTADTWIPLLDMHLSNSVSDEYAVAYIARNLSQGAPQPEETEQLRLRHLPFAEVVEMVLTGEITDALSVAAVLKTNEWIRRGKIPL
jgi:8-oxo-dGTP pyrophosphatase MutT (NUDIX family)